jgi:FixJ family two-component response regulator
VETHGLLARSFGSAEEFLESGLQRKDACLIVDIRMPGMSGLELQAKFKSDRCNTPIHDRTWRCESADAWREGAAEFPLKPFDDQVLLSRVRGALDM